MSIIAVVNRKGGCGKSTLAVHLAARLARDGHAVLLADLDRNRSASCWLRARRTQDAQALPAIQGHVIEPDKAFRRPSGITHIVIDTPGGMTGFELARVACYADTILMPVGSGRFDREAASASHGELLKTPRVASGRCKLAAIGMRVSARNNAAARLKQWAAEHNLPLIAMLRDSPLYGNCVERGYSLFDLPPQQVAADLETWTPLLSWLHPLMQAQPKPAAVARNFAATAPVLKPRGLTPLVAGGSRPVQRPPRAVVSLTDRAPAAPLLVRPSDVKPSGWRQRLTHALQILPLQRLLTRSP